MVAHHSYVLSLNHLSFSTLSLSLSLSLFCLSHSLSLSHRYAPAIEAFERAIAINPVLGRGALKRHLQQCLDASASISRRLHNQALSAAATNYAFVETQA